MKWTSAHDCPETIPGWDWEKYETAVRRVSRMQTHELLDWTDAAGTGMARGFSDHRKDGSLDSLEEIRTAMITLWALLQELDTRARSVLDPKTYSV